MATFTLRQFIPAKALRVPVDWGAAWTNSLDAVEEKMCLTSSGSRTITYLLPSLVQVLKNHLLTTVVR